MLLNEQGVLAGPSSECQPHGIAVGWSLPGLSLQTADPCRKEALFCWNFYPWLMNGVWHILVIHQMFGE